MPLVELDRKGIGADLHAARERLGFSLADVATKAGVARSHVWNLESSEKELSLGRLIAVCVVLTMPVPQLIAGNIRVNFKHLHGLALNSLEVFDIEEKQEAVARSISANYAAACCTIVGWAILTGEYSAEHWGCPTSQIEASIGDVLFKLKDDSVTRRVALNTLTKDPASAAYHLGLFKGGGSASFGEYFVGKMGERVADTGKIHSLAVWEPAFNKAAYLRAGTEAYSESASSILSRLLEVETNALLNGNVLFNKNGVPQSLTALIERLNAATAPRGSKARLAEFLGVAPQAVSMWLSGAREPNGDTTLRLLEWVQAEEAKTKSPEGAVTPTGQRTRTRKSREEKPSPSP